MRDPFLQGTIFTLAVFLVLVGLVYFNGLIACTKKWDDSRYEIFSGCMVNHEGIYMPESNIRVIKWVNE